MMADVPIEYHGREQTWLKHRVLEEYATGWAMKLGSFAERLWYVDCFAGPWRSENVERKDTSVYRGIEALKAARATWETRDKRAATLALGAIFVERSPAAYADLVEFLAPHKSDIQIHAFNGEFAEHAAEIDRLVGPDPAFLFVDPTGWKGADMDVIAKVVSHGKRDVLVNVMSSFLVRQKDRDEDFLREQMRQFLGLGDEELAPGLTEEELLALYRERFKLRTGLRHVADLIVMHPEQDRTYFRLVVGGQHPAVLKLFRGIEERVAGREQAAVRAGANQRAREARRPNQMSLLAPVPPAADAEYVDLRERGLAMLPDEIVQRLGRGAPEFKAVWPRILERHHVTHADVARSVRDLVAKGRVVMENADGKRLLAEGSRLRLAPSK